MGGAAREIMRTVRASGEEYLDILRMSDTRIRRILSDMDADGGCLSPGDDAVRFPYKPRGRVEVEMYYQAAHIGRYLVVPRLIAPKGMTILQGKFDYANTRCLITLRTADGKYSEIAARVRDCSHVSGRVHEVVLTFNEPIDLARFLGPKASAA